MEQGSLPGPSDPAIKKARRQTAFYPNVNSTNKVEKPFSRSAAKRDSVLALGSIEHLQYYFTKTGLAANRKPRGGKSPFVPALGPGTLSINPQPDIPTLTFDLPPSPIVPTPPNSGPQYPPEPAPYTVDPEVLKPSVIHDLEEVQDIWSLSGGSLKLPVPNNLFLEGTNYRQSPEFDVLAVLKATTRAIRSVRNYLLALPDDHPSHQFRSNLIEAFQHHSVSRPTRSRPSYASLRITPSKPPNTPQLAPIPPPQISTVPFPPDPLSLIRRAALDVLTVLRELEEHSRLPMTDDVYDIASSGSGSGSGVSRNPSPPPFGIERTASPTALSGDDDTSDLGGTSRFGSSTSSPRPKQPKSPRPEIIPLKVQGREKVVPVWSDPAEDEFLDDDEEPSKKDAWDDRLVLGGGWLYRTDIDPTALTKEREVVGRYLDLVDGILFGSTMPATPGQRGWQRAKLEPAVKNRVKTPRSSFGSPETSPRKSSAGSRRAVSAVLLDAMSELTLLTEEPESMEVLGEEDEEVPEESLPEWAKRSRFDSDPLARLHSFLVHHLPVELLSFLPMTSSPPPSPSPSGSAAVGGKVLFREQLLSTLSDGQILCTAYNIVVRKSAKPWGFIQLENVHDLLGLTEDHDQDKNPDAEMILGGSMKGRGKGSWTFRRTENLRYWAAALKLRYMIPITSSPGPQIPAITRRTSGHFNDPIISPPVHFEPKVVAGRESGWETMLETTLFRWMDAVLAEVRGIA